MIWHKYLWYYFLKHTDDRHCKIPLFFVVEKHKACIFFLSMLLPLKHTYWTKTTPLFEANSCTMTTIWQMVIYRFFSMLRHKGNRVEHTMFLFALFNITCCYCYVLFLYATLAKMKYRIDFWSYFLLIIVLLKKENKQNT